MSYYDWSTIVSKFSNNELTQIIRDNENEEKVSAARNELERRGANIATSNDLAVESIENVVPMPDENSPTLYSTKVIWVFSILFSVIFGAALFSINLKTINKKKFIAPIIICSILYTAFIIYLGSFMDLGTFGSIIPSVVGALIINQVLWIKLIGKEVAYHKKSYKIPLIIALSIFIPLTALIIWAMIYSGQL